MNFNIFHTEQFSKSVLFLILLVVSTKLFGQVKPITFYSDSLYQVVDNNSNFVTLPYIDNQSMLDQTDTICNSCGLGFYGKAIDQMVDVFQSGSWYDVPFMHGKIYVAKFKSSTSLGLQVFFKEVDIPNVALLSIYNKERNFVGLKPARYRAVRRRRSTWYVPSFGLKLRRK